MRRVQHKRLRGVRLKESILVVVSVVGSKKGKEKVG